MPFVSDSDEIVLVPDDDRYEKITKRMNRCIHIVGARDDKLKPTQSKVNGELII